MAKKTFPKIANKTKVKSISTEIKGVQVKFDNLLFSDGQYDQLHQWLVDKDVLMVTIEQTQAKMEDNSAEGKNKTDEIPFEEDQVKD